MCVLRFVRSLDVIRNPTREFPLSRVSLRSGACIHCRYYAAVVTIYDGGERENRDGGEFIGYII